MLKLQVSKFSLECGVDEAGRGCLAGPVTAAAVMLPSGFKNSILNDSKQLTEKQRFALRPIIETEAITFGVAHVFPKKIDAINILQASILAMHQAIDALEKVPNFIAIDGTKFNPYSNIPHRTIIKGDGKFLHIAAASVLAKTYRDAYMEQLHADFPQYNWKKNKGYPTQEHRQAIIKYGKTKHHRNSFRLLPEQYKLNL